MYIGKLNDLLPAVTWQLRTTRGGTVPCKEAGDPFRGERMSVRWSDLAPVGLELRFRIEGNFYLNEIVLRFGAKSEPVCVSLYTEDGYLLDRHCGETGCAIRKKELALSAEGQYDTLVLTVDAELSDVIIESIELYGADLRSEETAVFPPPTTMTMGDKHFPIARFSTVHADSGTAAAALDVLCERLSETVGMTPENTEDGVIRLNTDPAIAAGGYRLSVREGGIMLAASDLRGFVQSGETLIKLIRNGEIPACDVEDTPFCAFRGVHLFLPAPDQMDFCKRLIKYLLSPMGYNHMILEVAGAMRFRSHPEINDAFLEANRRAADKQWPPFPHGSVGGGQVVEQEDIRDLCAYARRFGIEVIPEIQSLGHVQFMTLAHPEIAERAADAPIHEPTDERLADVPPNEFYAHCYCPSNPGSYEILYDLIDEIVDVFRPGEYVHMGHDEIYQIGVCPVCRQRDPAELFAEDVRKLHAYLAKKGLKMMIWSDMLQPVTKYRTPSAIERIPQDVVMLDFIWYFHMDKDIEDNLLSHGFSVIAGNMYSSHYPRYESRIRKAGMIGGQVSAWVSTEEGALAREGKLYDFLYSAEMLWSQRYTSHARYSYDRLLADILPHLREQLKKVRYPSLSTHRETVLCDRGEFDPAGVTCGLSLDVGERCNSLILEHTATLSRHRLPWLPLEVIGHYAVIYEDGVEARIPVTYGGNVHHHARRHHQPYRHAYYRHNGYSAAWETDGIEVRHKTGEISTVYRFEWINPRAEVRIKKLVYVPAVAGVEDVFVRRVIGVSL